MSEDEAKVCASDQRLYAENDTEERQMWWEQLWLEVEKLDIELTKYKQLCKELQAENAKLKELIAEMVVNAKGTADALKGIDNDSPWPERVYSDITKANKTRYNKGTIYRGYKNGKALQFKDQDVVPGQV